eukprot:3185033-Prymnesium_polylepis.1
MRRRVGKALLAVPVPALVLAAWFNVLAYPAVGDGTSSAVAAATMQIGMAAAALAFLGFMYPIVLDTLLYNGLNGGRPRGRGIFGQGPTLSAVFVAATALLIVGSVYLAQGQLQDSAASLSHTTFGL